MPPSRSAGLLEEQIDQWRSYLRRRQAIHSVDVAELEDHLREQVEGLTAAGLATDEAFLVAVKRMGDLDALSREFAREHSDRLWKQLVVVPADTGEPRRESGRDRCFLLAVAAAVILKTPALSSGSQFEQNWASTPTTCLYLCCRSSPATSPGNGASTAARSLGLAATFVIAAVFANVYPCFRRARRDDL